MDKHIEVGSLVKIGPSSRAFFIQGESMVNLILEDFEHGIIVNILPECNYDDITYPEYEILIGEHVYLVVGDNNLALEVV